MRRALKAYQVNATEALVPTEERWAKEMPDVPASSYAALLERCRAIEEHAYNLGLARLDGNLVPGEAERDLAAAFPELDAEAIQRTWSRGVDYSQR
ncbi:hypothetical protein BH11MYX4_BH11MYX4_17500 [soil metagenome]